MVLPDPEPVGLGLGLGVMGGEVTGVLDGGGDDGLAGGLDVRVSGGDEALPWRKIGTRIHRETWVLSNCRLTKHCWAHLMSHDVEDLFDYDTRISFRRGGIYL